MKWIVGLGNPGKRYGDTRHNIGFVVVDRFALHHGLGPFRKKFSTLLTSQILGTMELGTMEAEKVFLVKPQTYMNNSGMPLQEMLKYYGGGADDLLVVHDDLDLPLGRLRFRSHGSSGGHRGVESIISSLGTRSFNRLKIGIGRKEGVDPSKFVLETLSREERDIFASAIEQAVKSLDVWIKEGVERASMFYNSPEPDSAREDKEADA